MFVALAKVFASTLSVGPRRFSLIALLLPVLTLGAACDSAPTAEEGAPGYAAAAVDAATTPASGPAPGDAGSPTDPNDSCITGCLRRWQVCNKEGGRRGPSAEAPDGGACMKAAAECLAACPSSPN